MLEALPVTDTRRLFRPAGDAFLTLLRRLDPGDWRRPTSAGRWQVRDVVAHMVDGALRRVSLQRDRHQLPPPPAGIESHADLVAFVTTLNREWVSAARRFSPAVLTSLYELASCELADLFESLPLDAPALFPVSWAGESASAGWFDIGREFTEVWHHHRQVREAVGAAPPDDASYLRAVLEIAIRGLPHAYRSIATATGTALVLDAEGASGGSWTLRRDAERWTLWRGAAASPDCHVRIADHDLERLLFNAVPAADAERLMTISGDGRLALGLAGARSVIV